MLAAPPAGASGTVTLMLVPGDAGAALLRTYPGHIKSPIITAAASTTSATAQPAPVSVFVVPGVLITVAMLFVSQLTAKGLAYPFCTEVDMKVVW